MTLQIKMARGALWALIERIGTQGVSFVFFMFVARLIGPKEYGLATMCFVFLSLNNIVIYCLVDGIVCLKIIDQRRLSTLFWLATGVGCIITLLTIASAAAVANVVGDARLEPILQLFSLVFMFVSISAVPTKLLYASLRFRLFALRAFFASLISSVIGMILASKGWGAYAIAVQQICLYAILAVVAFVYARWKPTPYFSMSLLKESILPGVRLMTSDVLLFCQEEIPRFLIGALLGPIALGHYGFVTRIRFALQEVLFTPLLTVIYPSLVRIGEDRNTQIQILTHSLTTIGVIIYPILALVAYTAPVFVPLIFGEAWTSVIPILQVYLCIIAVRPIEWIIKETMRSHNKMDRYLYIQGLSTVVSLALFGMLIQHGVLAFAIGILCWALIAAPIYIALFERWTGVQLWLPVLGLCKSLAGVLVMLGLIGIFQHSSIYPSNNWTALSISVGFGALVYFATFLLVSPKQMFEVVKFTRQVLNRNALEPSP
jgi:O-antigen/teichoic acid export membrane protein